MQDVTFFFIHVLMNLPFWTYLKFYDFLFDFDDDKVRTYQQGFKPKDFINEEQPNWKKGKLEVILFNFINTRIQPNYNMFYKS